MLSTLAEVFEHGRCLSGDSEKFGFLRVFLVVILVELLKVCVHWYLDAFHIVVGPLAGQLCLVVRQGVLEGLRHLGHLLTLFQSGTSHPEMLCISVRTSWSKVIKCDDSPFCRQLCWVQHCRPDSQLVVVG